MHVAALVWNLRRAPFDDTRVRRALTMALDRDVIVAAYLYGFGSIAEGPVPPEHPWYAPVFATPYDRASARALLDEAGWPEGEDGRFAFELLTVGSGDNALEQMIQAQLREVGIEVTIRQLELASFLSVAQGTERDYDALVTLIPGDLSLGHVAAMFDGAAPGPLAYPGYQSRDLDRQLGAVRDARDRAELQSAWQHVQRILARDHPTTWLYHARGLQGTNRRVLAHQPDLRGELADIAEWRVESGDEP
jgi:peptide/nickel transport system substrate-binding protein